MARVKQVLMDKRRQLMEKQAQMQKLSNVGADSNSSDEDNEESTSATDEESTSATDEELTPTTEEESNEEAEEKSTSATEEEGEEETEATEEAEEKSTAVAEEEGEEETEATEEAYEKSTSAAEEDGEEEIEAVDPIVIQVKDLESLRLILPEEEHWKCKCKISVRSRFKDICNHIKESLNDEELKRFRETQFGHLLDVPNHYQHSSQLLWYFILRQIEAKKEAEMWMMVKGTPMRFSMEEYAMITGLNFAHVSDRSTLVENAEKNSKMMIKYFDGRYNIKVGD